MHRRHAHSHRPPSGLYPLVMLVFFALAAYVVMLLWNAILPEVTGLKTLTYWQAAGLLLLSRILFGRFPSRGKNSDHQPWRKHHRPWRQKWMEMSEEERVAFREQWRERCKKRDEE
ncbi:MAG: hypothetical protein KDC54_18755 [Lewinella sp.]|nr:hypothetical protein [Lewinella sp.]